MPLPHTKKQKKDTAIEKLSAEKVKSYLKEMFLLDLKAGFITAVVALPLALAFALASGVSPVMGLYTAIVAGLLGSFFGGSKFSITGPTGAMVVLVLSTVTKFGLEGLLLAGILAGVLQIIFGLLEVGRIVKYLPLPVITGFTAGIGVLIFLGQIANALGLTISSHVEILETLFDIWNHLGSVNMVAVGITICSILLLILLPKFLQKRKILKNVPASIIVLLLSTGVVVLMGFSVPQVGSIAQGLPPFSIPKFTFELAMDVFPAALSIALLGAIESLLCAVVCDAMTNTKHVSNKELVSQGIANLITPFFGGIPATAAVARSAVNIREGAKTRMAGIYHAVFLLLVLLFLAPFAGLIPKAFLAGVLMVVSVRMVNFDEFQTIFAIRKRDGIIMIATMLFTVFADLVIAVQAGVILAICMLVVEILSIVDVKIDIIPKNGLIMQRFNKPNLVEKVNLYTLHGPLFFGAMSTFEHIVDEHLPLSKQIIVVRMRFVPFIDTTGVLRLEAFIKERHKRGIKVFITGITPEVMAVLKRNPFFVDYLKSNFVFEDTYAALDEIEKKHLS
jgi:SulP family sulfate permease